MRRDKSERPNASQITYLCLAICTVVGIVLLALLPPPLDMELDLLRSGALPTSMAKFWHKEELRTIAAAAVQSEKETGCPAEVAAAQCILESAWLKKAPGNNAFGIKDTKRHPGQQYITTSEYINGKRQVKALAFEVYSSIEDCFVDHGRLVTGTYERPAIYAQLWDAYLRNGDLERWVRGFGKVYATDPAYADKVLLLARSELLREALTDARR